jgi:hypothetical protein
MYWQPFITGYALRAKNDREPLRQPASETHPNPTSSEEERWIVCRQCHQRLTRPSERTAINGSHTHTFANPSGMVFEIGCFRLVSGLGFIGPPSYEFPWFAGHSWQIVICNICQAHLGWCFRGSESRQFFGLILDRLQEIDAPEQG